MNIQMVRENLARTIEGKKELLRNKYGNPASLDRLSQDELLVWNITAKFLRINVGELERILHDIDSCIKQDGTITWAEMH
jgi:hypothetical protein